ncbi:MAG: TraQ conjugal transfer family protein [Tannerella sp.]|jgi:hypothetical protein|nr:TraQ conjugal transfer family protein [Tannerella sp.]
MKHFISNIISMLLLLTAVCACTDDLDIRQSYEYKIETLPLPKSLEKGESVAMEFSILRKGYYTGTGYKFRYFQSEGKGKLTGYYGDDIPMNRFQNIFSDNFVLYYESRCEEQQQLDFVFEDNFGQRVEYSITFGNRKPDDEPGDGIPPDEGNEPDQDDTPDNPQPDPDDDEPGDDTPPDEGNEPDPDDTSDNPQPDPDNGEPDNDPDDDTSSDDETEAVPDDGKTEPDDTPDTPVDETGADSEPVENPDDSTSPGEETEADPDSQTGNNESAGTETNATPEKETVIQRHE